MKLLGAAAREAGLGSGKSTNEARRDFAGGQRAATFLFDLHLLIWTIFPDDMIYVYCLA